MSALRPEGQVQRASTIRLVYLSAVGLGLAGIVHLVQAVSALRGDELTTLRPRYFVNDHTTVWGWCQLVLGITLLVTAIGVARGSVRSLVCAAVIVIVALIASFVSVPFFPAWGVAGLIINGSALYAITTVGATGPWANPDDPA